MCAVLHHTSKNWKSPFDDFIHIFHNIFLPFKFVLPYPSERMDINQEYI